uniref:Replication-associated protein n=1 Tax=Grus nigricollis-associatied genomovirus TaxID=3077354 RepID=A0AAF1C0C3_9VIRU|nr:MAG: replication-associated protein [Grus nigricollis-associatied genomovirus]
MPSAFHLKNRRYVLFTYSQAGPDFDYWAVVDLLGDLGAWTCLETWELSASLEERSMLMAEFISMYSLISDGSFRRERFVYSMWEASTQTSSLLAALQRRLTTTRSRMATLWQADLEDRAETAIGTLIISGVRRHIADLLTSFCTFATSWLREILSAPFQTSGPTLTGSGTPEFPNTVSPLELSLTRQRLRESTSGCHSLLLELANHERGMRWTGSGWTEHATLLKSPVNSLLFVPVQSSFRLECQVVINCSTRACSDDVDDIVFAHACA